MRGATQTQYNERQGLVELLNSGLIKDRSAAIDGGAHVGTWTELLSGFFASVYSFEPGPAFEHLEFNAREWTNVKTYNRALADEFCHIESYHKRGTGKLTGYRVRKNKHGSGQGMPIDSLKLNHCGLIKLDIEGFEYPALEGARKTINRCRPFILVELCGRGSDIGKTDQDVIRLLESTGYRQVWKWHVDGGFMPEERL